MIMLDAITRIADRPKLGIARPQYDKVNLVLAITAVTRPFACAGAGCWDYRMRAM
jgi:hypothetical protein